jgi:hypothetical protein
MYLKTKKEKTCGFYFKAAVIVSPNYSHGSIKVVAKISQRKKEQATKYL